MGFKVADRVKERTTTIGTGSVALTGDFVDGFQSFASGISDGDTTFYVIDEKILNGDDHWEVGIGVFNSGSLTRDKILSSSLGTDRIDLNGSGIVSITYPSEHSVFLNDELYAYVGSGINFIADNSKYLTATPYHLYYDDRRIGYFDEISNAYISGVATYASGQAVQNEIDIAYISGIAQNAEDIAIAISGIGHYDYQNISSDINITNNDDLIFIDSSLSPINVYMPLASGVGGKQIKIKWTDGDNAIHIIASGSETIDGQSSFSMYHKYQSATLSSNNTNWFIT